MLIPFTFVVGGDGSGGMCACFPSLGFAGVKLSIACVFVDIANFLGVEFSF